MNRVLGTFGLTMLGIGCIVGTGIFVLTGIAAANFSGPALVISFVIAALACGCAALCYSEFAAMIPVAGSAYTYGYVALGEFWAWVIGWDLILEYAFAVSAVDIGWSGYFNNILTNLGIVLPKALTLAPYDGGIVNLPAVLILCVIAFINIPPECNCQQHHRCHQISCRRLVPGFRLQPCRCSQLGSLHALWLVGCLCRRIHHLLRLHRFRCCFYGG